MVVTFWDYYIATKYCWTWIFQIQSIFRDEKREKKSEIGILLYMGEWYIIFSLHDSGKYGEFYFDK